MLSDRIAGGSSTSKERWIARLTGGAEFAGYAKTGTAENFARMHRAFEEIFATSLPLSLAPGLAIRLPTVAGYAAAKMGAWLDRSEWNEVKDAPDLALILHWYFESTDVSDRLYQTPHGNDVLLHEDTDLPLASAHLLGVDVAETIGPARLTEMLERWPGDAELLIRELVVRGGPPWTRDTQRRLNFLNALNRGLTERAPGAG